MAIKRKKGKVLLWKKKHIKDPAKKLENEKELEK